MQPLVYKQALREFEVIERYEAGVVLTGPEVKAIRDGRLIFLGSYVKFVGNELYWINADIPLYKHTKMEGYDPQRSRKLLLHRKELTHLMSKIKARPGLTIVPLKCYTKANHLKLEIALSKGKKAHEIKSVEKARAIARDDKRMTKEYLKS
jgi:SsrA-binding protein